MTAKCGTNNNDCCKLCSNKRAMGSKVFGRWPIDAFKLLQPDEQVAFWQSETNSKETLEASLTKCLTDHRVKKTSDMHNGKFLPLTAWAVLGFDADLIKANCTQTEEHEVLGTTYRVDVHEVAWGEVYSQVEKDILTWKSEPRGSKRGREEKPKEKEKKPKKSRKSSSSSSKSSKSSKSSSSSRKSSASKEAEDSKEEKKAKLAEDAYWLPQCCGVHRYDCTHGGLNVFLILMAVSTAC